MAAFGERIFAPIHNAQPVRIYTGCGTNPAAGFINIVIAPTVWAGNRGTIAIRLFGNTYADLLK